MSPDEKTRHEDLFRQSNNDAHCSNDQQEQTLMAWPCHEERRRVNAEGCDEVNDEEKDT